LLVFENCKEFKSNNSSDGNDYMLRFYSRKIFLKIRTIADQECPALEWYK